MNADDASNRSTIPLPLSLIASCCAIGLSIGAVLFGLNYADNLEQKYIHGIAPLYRDSVINGSVLQKTAFNTPDLLPVYGASEAHKEEGPFQAIEFFRNYPTGFALFDAAKKGSKFLSEALSLASVGKNLQGKKVIISFTATQFIIPPIDPKSYTGLFTRLHANELIFSPWLSYSTKQLAAKRMREYPETLRKDPFLAFAMSQLSQQTLLAKVLYFVVFPLGRLQTDIMELQDHYQAVQYILQHQRKLMSKTLPHVPAMIDWQAVLANGRSLAEERSSGTPFGFSEEVLLNLLKNPEIMEKLQTDYNAKPKISGDTQFLKELKDSGESADLEMLLQILKELGAKPMLVGRPFNRKYYNDIGISDSALDKYYMDIESIAARFDVPLVDFKNFQNDIYFCIDPSGHTGQYGWAHVDKVYNDFYHEAVK